MAGPNKRRKLGCSKEASGPNIWEELLACCEANGANSEEIITALDALCTKTEATNTLLESLCDKIEEGNENQLEGINPILYCDDECNITGGVAFVVPEDGTDVPVPIYLDPALAVVATAPTGKPCTVNCQVPDTEFKFVDMCKVDATGQEIRQVTCILYVDGIEDSTSTIWIFSDGSTSMEAPEGLEPCGVCKEIGSQGTILDWATLKSK